MNKNYSFLFMYISIKIFSQRAKKVLGDFLLNSKNGVKTPSWRTLGIKNDPLKLNIIINKKLKIFKYRLVRNQKNTFLI